MDEPLYDDYVPDSAKDVGGPPYPEPDSRLSATLHSLAWGIRHPRQSAELSQNLAALQREMAAERSPVTRPADREAE